MSEDTWLNGDPNHRKQQDTRRRMSGEAGKGDRNRITNNTKFRLGMEMIRLKEAGLGDTEEYRRTEQQWRNA